MRGNIRKRSEGSWQITLDIGRDPSSGKRRQYIESVRGTKRLAEKRMAELVVSIEQGGFTKPTGISLGDWLLEWHATYVTARCDRRTSDSYLAEIQRQLIPKLGAIRLDKLSPHHLQAYYRRALEEGRMDGKGGLSAAFSGPNWASVPEAKWATLPEQSGPPLEPVAR